jgi:hypothetical protein
MRFACERGKEVWQNGCDLATCSQPFTQSFTPIVPI